MIVVDYVLTFLLVLLFIRYDLVLLAVYFILWKKIRLLLTD